MNENESDKLLAINNIIFPDREPGVINDAMLTRLIVEQGHTGEAGRLAQLLPVDYNIITVLRIEFQQLMRIDHLWVLPNLQKLSLKFNRIDRIENLHMLTQLKELDMSYNQLEHIENLEELKELEVLTLMGNKLTRLENLDELSKMTILSVGNNEIDTYDGIDRLRFMKNLYSLTLEGNPIADQPAKSTTFRVYIAAFLPGLKYYNYTYVKDAEREAGRREFEYELMKLENAQMEEVADREREERELADEKRLASSFVELLNGHQLFESFFASDEDGKVMVTLSEAAGEKMDEYRGTIFELTQQIYFLGLTKHESRLNEIKMFESCVNEAKLAAQQKGIDMIEEFLDNSDKMCKTQKGLIRQLFDENNPNVNTEDIEAQIDKHRDDFMTVLESTWFVLMEAEAQLFESLEEANVQFGHAINEMLNTFIEGAQGSFVNMRDAAVNFSEAISGLTGEYLNDMAASNDTRVPDCLVDCLTDKDALVNIASGSRDIHMLMIDSREDRMVTRARGWAADLVSNLLSDEIKRNRNKVIEINNFLERQRENFDRMREDVENELEE